MPDPAADPTLAEAYAACAALVRTHDPDRWIASLFWPDSARPSAHALLAFSFEIARVPDLVTEPTLGEIRLQWWHEVVENGENAGHPVAFALLDTIRRFNLDREALLALIEARRTELAADPIPDEAALDAYLSATSSAVFEAIGRLLAPGRLPPACCAAAGRAYGLTGLLRTLPWQVASGRLLLPRDLLERLGVAASDLLARRSSPALAQALAALRQKARGELDAMRAGLAEAGPARGACLPAFLCPAYLRKMEAPGLDPLVTPVDIAPWRRPWILWRAARRL